MAKSLKVAEHVNENAALWILWQSLPRLAQRGFAARCVWNAGKHTLQAAVQASALLL